MESGKKISGENTQGRLVYRANGDANSYVLLDADGNWFLSVLLNGQQVTALQEANLRRLAACWNACELIPTLDLESCYMCGGLDAAIDAHVAKEHAQYQRDMADLAAARALLVELMDHSEAFVTAIELNYPMDGEKWAERARAFLAGHPAAPAATTDPRPKPPRAPNTTA